MTFERFIAGLWIQHNTYSWGALNDCDHCVCCILSSSFLSFALCGYAVLLSQLLLSDERSLVLALLPCRPFPALFTERIFVPDHYPQRSTVHKHLLNVSHEKDSKRARNVSPYKHKIGTLFLRRPVASAYTTETEKWRKNAGQGALASYITASNQLSKVAGDSSAQEISEKQDKDFE